MKPTTPNKLLSKYAAARECALQRYIEVGSNTNQLVFSIYCNITNDLKRLTTPLEEKWKNELNFIIDNY